MKKIFLSIVLLGLSLGNTFAYHTRYMGGTYQGSTEDANGCHICCSRSDLYCYQITSPTHVNEGLDVQPFGQWQDDQSNYGSNVIITTYDENQNVIKTYTGYYYGMSTQTNQDGTNTANIVLEQQPRN